MASSSGSLFFNPLPRIDRNPNFLPIAPPRTRAIFNFSANSDQKPRGAEDSETERKSFAVATGKLFIGLASRFIKSRGSAPVTMFRDGDEDGEEHGPRGGGGAAVVDDGEMVWEQRKEDVEAEKERMKKVTSPGFSFSAAGLLFPYHLGSSAGAIVCAVIASGSSMKEALEATKILAEDCRSKGTAFRLGAVLRDILLKFLPDDVHIRSNGRVRDLDEQLLYLVVAVTQILWKPRGLLVDNFESKEDLINAVFTSSFIPGYLAPRPATLFRKRLCIDGGLTLFMPPTAATKTVCVCAFPTEGWGLEGIGISPDLNPENRATTRQLFQWALEPAEDNVLDRLFELGYMDAAVWAEQNPVEAIVEDESNQDNP
ncbi:hypothetical protein Syun_014278 [Stephania yunnanensis]|uniref:Patatin n=1 Tax=Stephania yunnanensis TaxID=152371 RepID=A0AAP0P8F5_9MAGN